MRTVWTYEVPLGEPVALALPINAKLLSRVAITGTGMKFWALVFKDGFAGVNHLTEERRFVVVLTGQDLPEFNLTHVGSDWDGTHAGHLFEVLGVSS